jgi:peptide-methionine (S)-S-oxide reductase
MEEVRMNWIDSRKLKLPTPKEALPGRAARMPVARTHAVKGTPMEPPFPDGTELAMFAMGCFWGAERYFWATEGVFSTQVGYSAGHSPNATYEEVSSGRTGHAEVVRVVFDPKAVTYPELLRVFFENHDPTQGMRQGADVGTQYRSGVYTHDSAQAAAARGALAAYQQKLEEAGLGEITTEVLPASEFYYAEDYHQQYLAKNPAGYCGHGGTGVSCPVGLSSGY